MDEDLAADSLERAGSLAAYAALALAVDPADAVAWRLWLGLGDAGVRSAAWLAFAGWSRELGLSAAEGLERMSCEQAEPFAGARELRKRYLEGLEAADFLRERRGFSLAKAAARHAVPAFSALLEPLDGAETPCDLLARLRSRVLAPSFAMGNRDVKIVSYGRLAGLNPRVLVMGGLMDGLAPSGTHAERSRLAPAGERARALEALACERRAFCDAAGKAGRTLYLSYAQRADEALARALGADVRRTRRELGRTLAVLAPSAFLDEAGDAAPPTLSGEQYLAAFEREAGDREPAPGKTCEPA